MQVDEINDIPNGFVTYALTYSSHQPSYQQKKLLHYQAGMSEFRRVATATLTAILQYSCMHQRSAIVYLSQTEIKLKRIGWQKGSKKKIEHKKKKRWRNK